MANLRFIKETSVKSREDLYQNVALIKVQLLQLKCTIKNASNREFRGLRAPVVGLSHSVGLALRMCLEKQKPMKH